MTKDLNRPREAGKPKPKRMTAIRVQPSKQERNWAAGLFEGEGTITIGVRKGDETYRLICIVGSTDLQIINFFHQRWGGWHQPAYGERPGRKRAWSWTVAGPAAEDFLVSVKPYLITKRVRTKLLLAMDFRKAQTRLKTVWSKPEYKAAQRQAYNEMRVLNKRGIRTAAATAATSPGCAPWASFPTAATST